MPANTNTDLRNGVNGDVGCKYPCDCATTANIELEGTQTIDGFSAVENTIVLVKDQTDHTENGVYVVSTGQWQRGVWFNNQLNAAPGSLISVSGGIANAKTIWMTTCADNPIVFGSSEITFTRITFASLPEKDFVIDFGGRGNDSYDNLAAFNLATNYINTTGGYVIIPDGIYRVSAATNTITGSGGFIGCGSGIGNNSATVIRYTGTTGDTFTIGGSGYRATMRHLAFSPLYYKTSGFEIKLTGRHSHAQIEDIQFNYCFGCIEAANCFYPHIKNISILGTYGPSVIKFAGTGLNTGLMEGANIDDIWIGSGNEFEGGTIYTSWTGSTTYSLNDYVVSNGAIWACVQAGTSAATGGVIAPTYSLASDPFSVQVVDGTVKWIFVSRADQAQILVDSYAAHIIANGLNLNSGAYGIIMKDTANTGSSRPYNLKLCQPFVDYTFYEGIKLISGKDINIYSCSVGRSLSESGIVVKSTFGGGVNIVGGYTSGNYKRGLHFEAGSKYNSVTGLNSGDNSIAGSNTYSGITFDNSSTNFIIESCKSGMVVGGVNRQKYGIEVGSSCDEFVITGNECNFNITAGFYLGTTPGLKKTIGCNSPDTSDVVGGQSFWLNGFASEFYVNGLSMVATNRPQFIAGGNAKWSINSNGAFELNEGQLAFPAIQNPSSNSNTLDDYEEGSWTPQLSFDGASVGITYASQVGSYTKIGRLVFVQCYIKLTNKGSSTGVPGINNLPFSSVNISDAFGTSGSVWIKNATSLSGSLSLLIYPNETTASLRAISGTGDTFSLSNSNFNNDSEISFSATYQSA